MRRTHRLAYRFAGRALSHCSALLVALASTCHVLAQPVPSEEPVASPAASPSAPVEAVPPRLVTSVEAEYPPEAVAAGRDGSVELRLSIDTEGVVTEAEVLSTPSPELGAAARAAALRFDFEPAQRGGTPVASRILYRYEFRLPEPPRGAIEGVSLISGTEEQTATPAVGAEVVLSAEDGSVQRTTAVAEPAPTLGVAPDAIDVQVQGHSAAERLRQSSEAAKVVETEQAQRESADLGEVLARTPGVGVRRTGGLGSGARFSLNGLTDDQIRFFLDGIPLDFTAYSLGIANVPVNLVESVEIYGGVVPVRFGANALGGAVNLVTARPRPGLHGAASYQVGSYGTHRATLSGQHRDTSTGLFTRVSGFFDAAENDYPVDVEVPNEVGRPVPVRVNRFHDAYRAAGGSVDVGLLGRPWARRLLLHGFVTDYDQDIQNNAVMTVPYGGVTYGETTAGGNVRYESALGDAWRGDAIIGYAHTRGHYVDVDPCAYDWFGECVVERPRGGEREGQPRDRLTWQHGVYGRANVVWQPLLDHELLLSTSPSYVTRTGDEQRQLNPSAPDPMTAERNLVTWVSGLEYRLLALDDELENTLFAKHYLQLARTEEPITGDVFVERDRDTSRFGFGDGFRYRFMAALVGKVSYEWATRLPRADEVFGDANTLLPNLDIQPEVSHNLNVGLILTLPRTLAGAFRAEALGFLRDADDLIVLLSDDMFQIYQNVYAARSIGVEASASWSSPGQWLTLEANGTYQSFRNASTEGAFVEFRGDRIPNRPWLFANLTARLKTTHLLGAGDELSLSGYARYVHSFFRGWESLGRREYKQVVPGYIAPTLALNYFTPIAGAKLSSTLEVDNITDTDVQDYFGVQRPGRTFSAKLMLSY